MGIRKLNMSLWKIVADEWTEYISKETRVKMVAITTAGVHASHESLIAHGTESKIRSARDEMMSDDDDDDDY